MIPQKACITTDRSWRPCTPCAFITPHLTAALLPNLAPALPFKMANARAPPFLTPLFAIISLLLSLLTSLYNLLLSYLPTPSQTPNTATTLPRQHDLRGTPLHFPNVTLTPQSLIAEGGFSYVYKASNASKSSNAVNNYCYAIKQILLQSPDIATAVHHELKIHTAYCQDHPNLLPCVASILSYNHSPSPVTYALLLFPYHRTTLHSLLYTPTDRPTTPFPTLDKRTIAKYIQGILRGLLALHGNGVVHMDLKPHNVLITLGDVPVLMDYGSCVPNGPSSAGVSITRRSQLLDIWDTASVHTTGSYRAPELWADAFVGGDVMDYRKCDLFSFGCVVYACVFGGSWGELEVSEKGASYVDCGFSRVLSENWKRNKGGTRGELFEHFREVIEGCCDGDRERRWGGERAWEAVGGEREDFV